MSVQVRAVSGARALGEGPHWAARARALYYVSIAECSIHKYEPATGRNTATKLDGQPGFIIPVDGTTDQFVVGLDRKFLVIRWDGCDGSAAEELSVLGEVDTDVATPTRINDGKVDPSGRLFAGTMAVDFTEGKKVGSLYRVSGGQIKKIEQGIVIANGLSWDLNEKAFYYTDSAEHQIRRYDYDQETGEISNLRYIFDLKKNGIEGSPDGHTIDTDGHLWIAVFGGGCVIQVDPRSGALLRTVPIPAAQVTSVTFGGPDLDILYVTTASININGEQKFPSGCTFEVKGLGAKGQPNQNYIKNE